MSTKRGRGRPKGSRNKLRPHEVKGIAVSGSSTSAAKMNVRSGVAAMSSLWVYVPGEGFVRWTAIEEQVREAHLQWRRKKAMEGVYVYDFEEQRQTEITGARALGAVRRTWLKDWQERHAGIVAQAA